MIFRDKILRDEYTSAVQLRVQLRRHARWLEINKDVLGGPEENYIHNELRANFSEIKLIYQEKFYNLDLRYADLSKLYIDLATFDNCDFEGANFYGSSIRARITNSSMKNTNLSKAKFECDFYKTDFYGAKTDPETSFYRSFLGYAMNTYGLNIPLACPSEGGFISWKKCIGRKNLKDFGNVIVKLLIPEYAKRSSATTKKCRCDEAIVLDIQDYSSRSIANEVTAHSLFSEDRIMYAVGKVVKPTEPFEENRFKECASGIHFFMDRDDAVDYVF